MKIINCFYNNKEFKDLIHDANYSDKEAQYELSRRYRLGWKNTERDEKKGFEWLEKSTEQAHVETQYYLGKIYLEGTYEIYDIKKAIELFKKVAIH